MKLYCYCIDLSDERSFSVHYHRATTAAAVFIGFVDVVKTRVCTHSCPLARPLTTYIIVKYYSTHHKYFVNLAPSSSSVVRRATT